MKYNKSNVFVVTSLLTLIGIIFILAASCSKEEIQNPTQKQFQNIITFESAEEYSNSVQKICRMTPSEIEEWEESKGYISYGRYCDKVYDSIPFEEIQTQEELLEYVAQRSDYLCLEKDEDGELRLETKLHNNINRYFIANQEQTLRIKDIEFSISNNGITQCVDNTMDMNYKAINLNLSSKVLTSNPNKSESLTVIRETRNKKMTNNCGNSKKDWYDRKRDRTTMWLYCNNNYTYDPLGAPLTTQVAYVKIRPYKRNLGIWVYCSRTISCDVRVALEWYEATGKQWYVRVLRYRETGRGTSVLQETFFNHIVGGGHHPWTNAHFAGIDAWGSTPSAGPAATKCNTSICY